MHQQLIESITVNCQFYIGKNGEYFRQEHEVWLIGSHQLQEDRGGPPGGTRSAQ
jgi:hypothetical protein